MGNSRLRPGTDGEEAGSQSPADGDSHVPQGGLRGRQGERKQAPRPPRGRRPARSEVRPRQRLPGLGHLLAAAETLRTSGGTPGRDTPTVYVSPPGTPAKGPRTPGTGWGLGGSDVGAASRWPAFPRQAEPVARYPDLPTPQPRPGAGVHGSPRSICVVWGRDQAGSVSSRGASRTPQSQGLRHGPHSSGTSALGSHHPPGQDTPFH